MRLAWLPTSAEALDFGCRGKLRFAWHFLNSAVTGDSGAPRLAYERPGPSSDSATGARPYSLCIQATSCSRRAERSRPVLRKSLSACAPLPVSAPCQNRMPNLLRSCQASVLRTGLLGFRHSRCPLLRATQHRALKLPAHLLRAQELSAECLKAGQLTSAYCHC